MKIRRSPTLQVSYVALKVSGSSYPLPVDQASMAKLMRGNRGCPWFLKAKSNNQNTIVGFFYEKP